MVTRLLFSLCLFALTLLASPRAEAHAALIGASPADGAVIATAPATFTLGFSEPVSPLVLRLIAPDGTPHALKRFALKDRALVIDAPGALAQGTHVLSWRVVSEDGHPVGGSVLFSIGAQSAGPTAPVAQGDAAIHRLLWIAKLCLYLGLFFGIGGTVFPIWVAALPQATTRISQTAMVLGLFAVPFALAAQGADALDVSVSALLRPEVWRAGAATSFAWTLLIAALALIAGLISLRLAGRVKIFAGMVALAGAGLALAASGHASAASPQWLMRPAVFLHALAITAWIGALIPLAELLRSDEPGTIRALSRFSRRIPAALVLLVVSGLVLAVVQVERPQALLATDYGQVLLLKLVWLTGLFALAAWNRFRLTQPTLAGDRAAQAGLRRSILLELGFILLVLGTVALWRFTPPPRALAVAAAQPVSIHIHAARAMADVTLTPGRVGPIAVDISLLSGEFEPLAAKEVKLTAANPAAGVEPIERSAARGSDGSWLVEGLSLPVAGRWTIELEILVSDFELVRISGEVEIRR